MVTKLLFVHGTGVRQAGYDESVTKISKRLAACGLDIQLVECRWGEAYGVDPIAPRSVPHYRETGGINVVADEEFGWSMLLHDPAVEMRQLVRVKRKAAPKGSDGRESIRQLHQAMQSAMPQCFIEDQLADLLVPAVAAVQQDYLLHLQEDPQYVDPADLAMIMSRATVARVIGLAADRGLNVPNSMRTVDLIDAVQRHLIGETRGIFGSTLRAMMCLAGPLIASYRGKLMDVVRDALGDILSYQARGADIRRFILERLGTMGQDKVIILAHSLGGIASLETLVEYRPKNVTALITFGSQAPWLYELNALSKLPHGSPLPEEVPCWLNFYNVDDPLSFVAGALFPGRAVDYQVNSGSDPLSAHSAYLDSDQMWTQIFAYLK